MAKKKVGRRPIHRLAVMGNIDGGGRVVAAVPLFQPGQPYPLGLSLQRLQGSGAQGVVVRMVGADGNMATMVVTPGKDAATVALFTDDKRKVRKAVGNVADELTPEQASEALNSLADTIVEGGAGPDDYPVDTARPGANVHGIGPDEPTGPNPNYAGDEVDPLPGEGDPDMEHGGHRPGSGLGVG